MPSTSAKQHRFMEAIAHNSAFAKKAGVSQSVGKDFSAADKGKQFTGMKGGGRTRRFDEGGDISDEQAKWLGKADRTDPIIMARMRAAVPDRPRATPAPVEERNVNRVGSTVKEPEVSPPPRALPPTANTPAPISEEIKDETGKVSNIRRNLETGDLYNSVGGPSKRAAAPVPKPKPKVTPTPEPAPAAPKRMRDIDVTGFGKGRMPVATDLMDTVVKRKRNIGDEFARPPAEIVRRQREKVEPSLLRKFSDQYQGLKKGGMPMESKDMVRKEVDFFKKKGAPKSMIAHEKAEMKGYAKGGGIESRGKTKGAMVRMATGGSVSSASRRADGIAQRGKTRC